MAVEIGHAPGVGGGPEPERPEPTDDPGSGGSFTKIGDGMENAPAGSGGWEYVEPSGQGWEQT